MGRPVEDLSSARRLGRIAVATDSNSIAIAVSCFLLTTEALTVLGDASTHTCAPEVEAFSFELSAHECDDLVFSKLSLFLDGFKTRAVAPRHANDVVHLLFTECFVLFRGHVLRLS